MIPSLNEEKNLHIIYIPSVNDLRIPCNTRFRHGRQNPSTTSQWIQVRLPILLLI